MPTYPTYKLSKIARSTKGKKPKSVSKEKKDGFEIPYVDIKAFEKGIVDNYTDGENCTFCKPDDVLIVWDGARCGFVGRGVEGAIGSTLAKISSDKYTNDFLFYFLQSKYKVLNSNPRGVGIPHIEPNLLWNFEIPDVDKNTQQAIVARIEALFAELDKAVQHLRIAQQQLKTYRQAVLNHWLTNGSEKWQHTTIGNIVEKVEYGSSAKSEKEGKVPVLRMGNIQKGRFDWSDLVYSNDDEEISKYLLKKDDVLFNRTNSPELVGKTAIYKGERPAIFAGYLIRLHYKKDLINADFLNYYLNSDIARNYGNTVKSDGVNQSNINGQKLKTYPLYLPPLAEQQRIVKEIESRLSQATATETYIENALQQAEALRQSILKKAFSGELVVSTSSTTSKGG